MAKKLNIPQRGEDGQWYVGEKAFDTNAKAWRYFELQNNDPISRAQDVADWVANKLTNGE